MIYLHANVKSRQRQHQNPECWIDKKYKTQQNGNLVFLMKKFESKF